MVGSSRRKVMGQCPGARKPPPPPPACTPWLALLLGLGAATTAHAEEPPSSHLSVARGEGALDCPDEARFSRQVAALTSGAIEPGLRIQVEFVRRPTGLEATLRVSGPRQGLRSLADPGPSCAALAEAAAVTVALLLDPQSTEKPAPPRPPPLPPPPLPPPPREAPLPARLVLGLGPAISGRLTAQPAFGVGLGGGLRPQRRGPGVEAGLLWLPRRAFPLPDPGADAGSGEVRVSLLAARGAGCWWLGDPSFQGAACAEVGAGAYLASGVDYYRTQDSTGLWIGAGPGLRAAGKIAGPVGWGAGASWFFPLHRHDFVIDRVGKAFEAPAGGGWIVQATIEAALW
jgi:hypothetical protein